MQKKELKKAFDAYAKTGNIYALSRSLRKLILYFIEECEYGIDVEFWEILPYIEERLKSLDLSNKK